jgi:hypothetical protein
MALISKHLEECLEIIKKLKITPFQPIDVFPKIKRADWVFKQLVETGYLTKFWVGEEAFYQLSK